MDTTPLNHEQYITKLSTWTKFYRNIFIVSYTKLEFELLDFLKTITRLGTANYVRMLQFQLKVDYSENIFTGLVLY